ncbi:hypothetical protein CTI12_AA234500 [Artemisia annua]|uniref:Zinc knuckle CX2CX4HX4C n=1 Tax=Artemisia annua TaxID=35608 RepID=A0A2U1NRV0_ARTAN|nr:hypothetical protein CTI12_AA234500 [Artemisia annua]
MNDLDLPNPNPMLVPPPKESNDVSRQSRSTRSQVNAVSKSGLGSMKKSLRKGSNKKRLLKGMDGVKYEVEDTEEMDTRDENLEVDDGNSTVGVNTNEEDGVGSGLDEVSAAVNQTYGRASFARVLIEVDATSDLVEEIEVCYEKMGKAMMLKVEYTWRPPLCTHCKVFGHEYKKCSNRVITMEERNEKAKDVNQSRGRNGMMGRGNMSQRNSYENNGVRFVQVESEANKVDETQVWETKNKNKQDNKGKSASVSNESLNNKNKVQKNISTYNSFDVLAKEMVEEGSDEWVQMRKKIDLACDLGMQIADSEKTKWSEDLKKYYKDKCDAKAKAEIWNIPLDRKEYYRRMVDELSRPCDDTPMFIMSITKMELPPSVFKLSSVMNVD